MTNERNNQMTCDDFNAALAEYMDGTLDAPARSSMDAHRIDCAECAAFLADFTTIRAEAGKLPLLSPSRDLWAGIEARIEAPVVQLPVAAGPDAVVMHPAAHGTPVNVRRARRTRRTRWQIAAAATILVASTAGITWTVALRTGAAGPGVASGSPQADSGFDAAMALTRNTSSLRNASRPALNQMYEGEISSLRRIVDERRADLDSATTAILEKNLKVIDDAIAESKAALAKSPASAFLLDRLTDAYDSKLRTLRAIAAMPQRG